MSEPGSYDPFLEAPPQQGTQVRLLTPEEQIMISRAPKRSAGEGPRTYDYRHGQGPAQVRLENLTPGDVIFTDKANVRIDPNGAPQLRLRRGGENGRDAGAGGPVLIPRGPPGVSVDVNMSEAGRHTPIWFRKTVPNRGPWDYKQQGPQYEAFGNFNYGAAGRSNRVPSGNLFQEAGLAQARDGNSRNGDPGVRFLPATGTGAFGDDPVDQFWIEEGVRYHDQGW